MASLTDVIKEYLKGEDYTLKAGETFANVADRYGMVAGDLWAFKGGTARANSQRVAGATPASAKAGEVIRVPKLPATVAAAPASITLPAHVAQKMEELWQKSIEMQNKVIRAAPSTGSDWNVIHMDERSLEHGGTYCWVVAGKKVELFRTGAGTDGTFSPDTSRTAGRYIIGDFHTHPYTRFTDGEDNTDQAFSGGDLEVTVGWTVFLDMVQSGKGVFLSMRTKATPRDTSNTADTVYDREFSAVRRAQRAAGKKFDQEAFREATFKAAKKTCATFNLAFYHGTTDGTTATLTKET